MVTRKLAKFPGQQAFPTRPTSEVGDAVFNYEGNAMSPAEVERQRKEIMRSPLVLRDSIYPFSEDVIVDETGAVEPSLGFMAKISSLIKVLRLGGNF